MKKSELRQIIREQLSTESLKDDVYKAIDKYMKDNRMRERKQLFADAADVLRELLEQLDRLAQ